MSPVQSSVRNRSIFVDSRLSETEFRELRRDERIALESACIDAIGELEHLLALSNAESEAGFLGESALIGDKMLHTLIRFAEENLRGPRLTIVYELVEKGFQATKHTVSLSSSQTFGTFRRLIGRPSATDTEVAEAHAEAGKAIAMAAIASLGGGIRRLQDQGTTASDLCESLRPILITLREEW